MTISLQRLAHRRSIRAGVLGFLLATLASVDAATAQEIQLPDRSAAAPAGATIVEEITRLELETREARLVDEVLSGNVPTFLRRFEGVELRSELNGKERRIQIRVLPDVLAVGDDDDFFRIPLSPQAAQVIADRTGTSLPTAKISAAVWAAASLRLVPQPIPPSEAMTTVPVFADHHWLIERAWPVGLPRGMLVAGIKKDVVLTPRLADEPGRVAIYGWHWQDGTPIQPVYTGHTDRWVDYSHGIRLVSRRVLVDGIEHDLVSLLEDPVLWALVSDEGPMESARYPTPR